MEKSVSAGTLYIIQISKNAINKIYNKNMYNKTNTYAQRNVSTKYNFFLFALVIYLKSMLKPWQRGKRLQNGNNYFTIVIIPNKLLLQRVTV